MGDRIISGKSQERERVMDADLRPKRLSDYIGQDRLKENLDIFVEAAKGRGEPLDHVLFYGPPGLGKTTLAYIIANEMGTNLKITSGPAIERPGDLASLLTNLSKGDVLFIDEIHRLGKAVEEVLYPAMEDFALDLIIGKGPSARSVRLKLPRFTIAGATTRLALMTSPLRGRFGVVYRLDFYDAASMEQIVIRSAGILGVRLSSDGAQEIARRSRGTPRVANRLLKRIRDYAEVLADGVVTGEIADAALVMLEVDHLGLDQIDRKILASIATKFGGGPVGLDTLAAAVSEEPETVEDVYEPYLMQLGFLQRTPRGRMALPQAFAHLGLALPGRSDRLVN